jgi:hypothetical protein
MAMRQAVSVSLTRNPAAYLTGAGKSELPGLTWDRLDFTSGIADRASSTPPSAAQMR